MPQPASDAARDGLLRLTLNWLVTGALSCRFGLSPVGTVVRGGAVPGSCADVIGFHDGWEVSVFAFLPDEPADADVACAVDRALVTHDAVLARFDPALTLEAHEAQLFVVAPGGFSARHADACTERGVSYLSAGCDSVQAGRLRWLNS